MNIIIELMNIGFTEYEAKVYDVLVNGGLMSANDITRHSSVKRGRVYDVLNSLMDKGLCELILGTVKKYRVIEPQKAFSGILEEQKEKERKLLKIISTLQLSSNSTKSIKNELDFVSVYTSASATNRKTIEMITNTKEILRALCKPPYLYIRKAEELEEKSKPQLKSVKHGSEFHCIYEIEKNNMDSFIKMCTFFHEHGEKVRVMEKLPLKLTILDSNSSMFTLFHKSLTHNNITSMYIENSDIVVALIDLFEYYWKQAIPFEDFIKQI
jgi:HTH-type transcriptional regulator, sugar sensing transcriptional regulator